MYIYEWVGRLMATLLGSCTVIGKIWLRATAIFVGSEFLKARTLHTNSAVDGPSHAMHVAYCGTAFSWVQALFAWSHANFLSICKIANSYTSAERFPNMTLILANWISIRNTILALSLGPIGLQVYLEYLHWGPQSLKNMPPVGHLKPKVI